MRKRSGTTEPLAVRMHILQGSKVTLPARERLLDRLFEETDGVTAGQRLTLFLAPLGYGKTETAASWLGDGTDATEPVRWIDCADPQPASDPNSLWHRVIDQLTPFTEQPEPVRTAPHASSGTDAEATQLARVLRRPITLVLDNYHSLTTPANDLALARLAAASPLLNLVVVARRVSVLTGPLVMAKARVRVVGPRDLALTLQEQHELAFALGIPASDALTRALTMTDGWPLAVRAALTIGSDLHHVTARQALAEAESDERYAFDPLANVQAFTINCLDITSPDARTALLAASLLDAISFAQIQQITGLDTEAAQTAINELLEFGQLREIAAPWGTDYQCHLSLRSTLSPIAAQTLDPADRNRLAVDRARDIEPTAPLAAFMLYCQAEDYDSAEMTLANNFTTLTDEVESFRAMLRTFSEPVLSKHPTFTAALLFLERPNPATAKSTLEYLTSQWLRSLQERLPAKVPTETDPLYLQLLCQAMVATRTTGQIETSVQLMDTLESRLTPDLTTESAPQAGTGHPLPVKTALIGSAPTYYKEMAATALASGDLVRARRSLGQLRDHSLRMMATPGTGFGYAAIRRVTAAQSGVRWLLAALSELAYIELIDGDIHTCTKLVAEADEHAKRSGEVAPGIAGVSLEVARAHLAYELGNVEQLAIAAERLEPFRMRVEKWPLAVVAEVSLQRRLRGPDLALSYLRSTLSSSGTQFSQSSETGRSLTAFNATLCSATGNLLEADALLSRLPEASTRTRIERARLALYSGDNVTALLTTQGIGDPETTLRQRVDRGLIGAVAAWGCNRPEEAFVELAVAVEYLTKYGLQSRLQTVPYDELVAVAAAAKEAGVYDATGVIASVPEVARSVRYERLTEMELQTLLAIHTHRNANQAAASLHVTPATVKKHLVSVYKKLRAHGRDEAILQASRMGLLNPEAF